MPWKKWNTPHSQQKSLKCSTLVHPQKQQNDFGSFPRQTIQHQSNQTYAQTNDAKKAGVHQFYEDLNHLL